MERGWVRSIRDYRLVEYRWREVGLGVTVERGWARSISGEMLGK